MGDSNTNKRLECDMESEDDDDYSSCSDDEMDDNEDYFKSQVVCLFCKRLFFLVDTAVRHCENFHGLDLPKLKGRHKMDCYSYIKLVNFVRSTHPDCDEIMSCEKPLWNDDKYLTPVITDDPWLSYDFDDVDETPPLPNCENLLPTGYPVNIEDGRATLAAKHFFEIQQMIRSRNAEIRAKDEAMAQLLEEIKHMKETVGAVIGNGEIVKNNVGTISSMDDKEYFNTYAHYGIHHEMLSDEVRTVSYREAINAAGLEGKVVLDLGCGTGILSMFCARAGATRVIAIDQSDVVYHAMDIVRENQLEDRINVVKGRIEDTALPEPKVDVIVSEWMGYFLLFEAMLDSVIYARNTHLRPGGLLLPNRCSLSIVGVNDQEMHQELVGFWSDVYGFKMSSLRSDVVQEPHTSVVLTENVATTAAQLCLLDLMTVTTECMDFESDFVLTATKDTTLTALAGYFDVFFDLPNPVMFSTGPLSIPTHWKQTIFLIENPIVLKQGEEVHGKLMCQRNRKEVRSLTVTITIRNTRQKYLLS